jgi:hypothetical protein
MPRRPRHQDRLDIAAGLQTERRAAVVEQVELDIAAATNELMAPLLGRPAGEFRGQVGQPPSFQSALPRGVLASATVSCPILDRV